MSGISIIATLPLKGRDVKYETSKTSRKVESELHFDVPILNFERDTLKKNPKLSKKGKAREFSSTNRVQRDSDGSYSFKMSDSTWGTTFSQSKEHLPSKELIYGLKSKYETNIDLIAGYNGVEKASQTQAINDLLIDELTNQFRTTDSGYSQIFDRLRTENAQVFRILSEDLSKSKQRILELENIVYISNIEREKTIEECNNKISETETEAIRKIKETEELLKKRTDDFDNSMKTFLEQKNLLEEHVKSLHHVFLDFQSDAVYLTLEELKQQLSKTHQRVIEKEEDVTKLQQAIQKWKEENEKLLIKQKELEKANEIIRVQLQDSLNKNLQYARKIELLKSDLLINNITSNINLEEENNNKVKSPLRANRTNSIRFNSMQFVEIYRKLSNIGNSLSKYIEKNFKKVINWNEIDDDENERQFLSVDIYQAMTIIEKKVDFLFKFL